ncbi:MAG: efflux RND transporter permease subunit [Spirochaetales bacterium]|nr:efflux RND transporter permease subunit [Spirochaetales bacterium]
MLKTILNRPVAVVTVFTIVLIIGLILAAGIPVDMYPDMEIPLLGIMATFPGSGPEEIEDDIIRKIEGVFSGMENLDSLKSTSYENWGFVLLEFHFGTDITESQAEARSRLDRVMGELPEDADDPVLIKFDPASIPIMTLAVTSDRTEKDLMLLIDDHVIPRLESLEGVASVDIKGLREPVVLAEMDQSSLESFGLSLTTVANIVAAQNFQVGAGSLVEGDMDILIRTSGRLSSLDELEETVILNLPAPSADRSVPIHLKDMGAASWGYEDPENQVRIDGEKGVYLAIRKGSDANSVEVADAVKAALTSLNRALPDGVHVSELTDDTQEIRNNLAEVGSAAILGILFAVLVLLVFLRQIKSTLIVALSIPIALVITVAGLGISGRTLNLITLVGLSMGVGLIVDSSIVIIENIYRLRSKGAPMGVSALRGAGEMMSPIVASTLTTIAVFLPLIIYKNDLEFIGIFFGELAFVIILALLASLAVAGILVPVLSSRFLTIQTREEKPLKNPLLRKIDSSMEKGLDAMADGFASFLSRCMRHKAVVILSLAAVLVFSFFLAGGIDVAMMPDTPEEALYMEADFPTGTDIGEVEKTLLEIQRRVQDRLEGVERIVLTSEKSGGDIRITFEDHVIKGRAVDNAKEILREVFPDFPGINFTFPGTSNNRGMNSSGVDVSLTGSDWDEVLKAADQIALIMGEIDGISEVENQAEQGLPQLEIIFDRKALYDHGLSAAEVAMEIRALTYGVTATTYIENGESYDVVFRLREEDRSAALDLNRMFITNASGERIMVSQIAEVERSFGPATIKREEQIRQVNVIGSIAPDAAPRTVTEETRMALEASSALPPGVEWHVGGEMEDFDDMGSTMLSVLLVALLMVIGVMVAQFESVIDPFIIFLAMPLMAVGIIAVFLLTGTRLSMIALMGIVMLLGIVVNNGIVLVDNTRLLRRRGMGVEEAAVESGRTRLKPVLMTSLTTILAMTPMAFFPGESGATMQPMGVAVVGGLISSMAGTLILVPVLYALAHRKESEAYISPREKRRLRREAVQDRKPQEENL